MIKKCLSCNTDFDLNPDNFYSNGNYKGRVKYKPTCKGCEAKARKARFDEAMLSVFGEIKCQHCGYDRCKQAIDCHHLDGDEKEYEIGTLRTSANKLETLIKEFKKCVLLCAVCHRELHAGLITLAK